MTFKSNLIGMMILLINLMFASTGFSSNPISTSNGGYVYLPAGTSVTLELNTTVNSEKVQIGQSVNMRVRSDVVVNNKVVIRAGSYAKGRVSNVNKSCNYCSECDNICASVTIVAEKVFAADGSQINLEGTPFEATGQCCGVGPALIYQGTTLDATVRNNTKILL